MGATAAILLIVIPLLAGALHMLGKALPGGHFSLFSRIVSAAVPLACIGILVSVLPDVMRGGFYEYAVGGWGLPVGISLRLDGIAWLGSMLTMVVAAASLLFAWPDVMRDGVFGFFFMVAIAGMEGVMLTDDLFNLFVFLEIIGLSVYVLITYGRKPKSVVASFRYLLLGSLGMVFFLLGVLLVYRNTGSFSIVMLGDFLGGEQSVPRWVRPAGVFMLAGIGIRTAFVPFHTWLPDAHGYAPHPVSAMLSGAMIKVSFIALWRVFDALNDPAFVRLLLWIGAVTAFVAVLRALVQKDSKKLLAYHSISQMGYILAGFGAAEALARTASLYHAAGHALFKSLLFLTVGAVIDATGERDIYRMGNLGRKFPVAAAAFAVAALAIVGMPPMNGYISKKLLLKGLAADPLPLLLIRLTGIGTAASFIKLSRIFLPACGPLPAGVREPGRIATVRHAPLLLLAGLCVLTGLWPGFWMSGVAAFIGSGGEFLVPRLYGPAEMLDAVSVLALGFILYLGVRSPVGRSVAHRLEALQPGLNGSLDLMILGVFSLGLLVGFL